MAKRTVNPSMLAGLVEGAATQEIQRGAKLTEDPKFPVFTTPVNESIIVYIPKTNMTSDENGEKLNVLKSILHDTHVGKQFGTVRCINGLSGSPLYDELGYDGTCPACEAMADEWELYNIKMKAEAERIGVDLQNDPEDRMKAFRQDTLSNMALKAPEEFVTFPIVRIPTKGVNQVADDALDNLQPQFVHFRKKRYDEKICGALKALMSNPGHLGGQFMIWDFSYNTEGKQATAMDSAKNATYTIIQDSNFLQSAQPLALKAEEVAKEFTLVKAAEVVVKAQFHYKEDIEADVNRVMTNTRKMLQMAKIGGTAQIEGGAQPTALPQGDATANPLANFGAGQPVNGNLGQAPTQQGEPAQQGASPVAFG